VKKVSANVENCLKRDCLLKEKNQQMKNQEKVYRESEPRWMKWGPQPRNERYDLSHERFVVPWQMERREKKITIE
jgi:hypothetical protein